MHTIITDHIDEIARLCRQHGVGLLYAFGSVCTEKFGEQSDIDLLVSFQQMSFGDYADNYFSLANKMEALLGRPVDLITDKSLSNPYFIKSLNRTKTLIYGQPDKEVSV